MHIMINQMAKSRTFHKKVGMVFDTKVAPSALRGVIRRGGGVTPSNPSLHSSPAATI